MKSLQRLLFVIIIAGAHQLHGVCTAPGSVPRIWDTLTEAEETLLTIDSKIDLISGDFDGTFTALDAVLKKACTVDSKVDIISGQLESLSDQIISIDSKVDIIDVNR